MIASHRIPYKYSRIGREKKREIVRHSAPHALPNFPNIV